MKTPVYIKREHASHWVGDGFPVRSIFSYNDLATHLSPFLLMDYGGPHTFAPTNERRGVGAHPHRGFETVTIVYDGEVEHKDSAGGGGRIGKGDVQWMTAASGVVHQEYHGADFARQGGDFEMVQLWVNLAARHKMAQPRYQTLTDAAIPRLEIPGGSIRVIAGAQGEAKGPALTFSPMNVLDVSLGAGSSTVVDAPGGWTAAVLVLRGALDLGRDSAKTGDFIIFDRKGAGLQLSATEDARLLVLSGEPIDEPIAAYGPFVMNTRAEIQQAIVDFNAGRMGRIVEEAGA